MHSRLQPYVSQAATLCVPGCNPTCPRQQAEHEAELRRLYPTVTDLGVRERGRRLFLCSVGEPEAVPAFTCDARRITRAGATQELTRELQSPQELPQELPPGAWCGA